MVQLVLKTFVQMLLLEPVIGGKWGGGGGGAEACIKHLVSKRTFRGAASSADTTQASPKVSECLPGESASSVPQADPMGQV